MDASWSPGRLPSKHADFFNTHRAATARETRKPMHARETRKPIQARETRKPMARLPERLQRYSSPNFALPPSWLHPSGAVAYPAVQA
jgi:hypothetical protein